MTYSSLGSAYKGKRLHLQMVEGGRPSGRTKQDSQRKKERLRLRPSVRLAGIQTTAHRAQAHASLPLSAIVAQRRRTQTTGPRNRTQKRKKYKATAEHKRALVLVNRARNAISAGIKSSPRRRNMTHFPVSHDKAAHRRHTSHLSPEK